jgi:hypothetical protein
MEIKYQVFENDNLFIQRYTGIFSMEIYQTYTRFITKYISTKPIEKVLVDFRGLVFNDHPEKFSSNLNKVVEFRKTINETDLKNKDIFLVFWVDKPMPTVIVDLFSANFPNCNYCSTEEIIIETLMLPKHLSDLDHITKNLESTFDNG